MFKFARATRTKEFKFRGLSLRNVGLLPKHNWYYVVLRRTAAGNAGIYYQMSSRK